MSSISPLRTSHSKLLARTALAAIIGLLSACDAAPNAGRIQFAGEAELFPGLSYDTGLVPEGSPVRASFAISAAGAASVAAAATVSGSSEAPSLTGHKGEGRLSVSGGFAMTGRLVVELDGLPSYDGPIPGLEDLAIVAEESTSFDPFAIGRAVTVRADIPPQELPAIPLPGGIPGSLVLSISEGSYVEVTANGKRACVLSGEAEYQVDIVRGGQLVIEPLLSIEVPFVGAQTFEAPSFSVPVPVETTNLRMTSAFDSFGSEPSGGDTITETCEGTSAEPGNDGGTSQGGAGGAPGSGGTGAACETAAECPESLPCVEGTCSAGGGVCSSGLTFGDDGLDACASNCCVELEACTLGYSDPAGCVDCLTAGSGPRCDTLLSCMSPCSGFPICDSGLSAADQPQADCLSQSCCSEFADCTYDGVDPQGCFECIDAGGGPRCDQAIECMYASCA